MPEYNGEVRSGAVESPHPPHLLVKNDGGGSCRQLLLRGIKFEGGGVTQEYLLYPTFFNVVVDAVV